MTRSDRTRQRSNPELAGDILTGLITYPVRIVARLPKMWSWARRSTSWRRAQVMIDEACSWPDLAWGYFIFAIPLLLLAGWLYRRVVPLRPRI